MASMSTVDYIVFGGVLLGSSLIGVYYAWKERKGKDEQRKEEYLQGGKSMGVIPVSLSLVASLMSSLVVLGIPAEMFTHSVQYWLSNIGAVVGIIVCDKIFMPMFYDLQLASVNKYLLKRFNFPALRIVSSLSYIISGTFVSGTVVYGPALALSSVTPLSIDASIIAVGLVCTFYTAAGGMKAVIWTDVLQLVVMIAGMLMVAVQGTITVGGWDNVWKIAEEGNIMQWGNFRFDPTYGAPTLWECVLGMLVLWAGTFSTNQMCVQRFCSLPTLGKARLSTFIGIPFTAVFLGLSCYCGVTIFANYYNCDPLLTGKIFSPDQLMPYFVMESLGYIPGLSGLFVAAVFSGSLSTLSSAINSMTILTWDDFLKKFIHVNVTFEVIIVKVIALLYGVITIAVAFLAKRMGSVLEVVLLLCGGIVGPQFGMFLLGAVCPFVDGKSAMFSFIFGQVFCMAFNIAVMVTGRPMRRLPTSTDGCPAANATSSFMMDSLFNSTTPLVDLSGESHPSYLSIHNISPFFMPFMGMFATVVSGILATIVTGGMNQEELDPRYVSPVVRKYLKNADKTKKTQDVEISVIGLQAGSENGHIPVQYS